jgi:vacuolar-type H+-ATPase subunit D/Vma8
LENIVSDLDDLVDQLKQKRDELREQMHLASKEAQDEWEELEEKMTSFTAKAKLGETGEGVGDALGQLGHELKKGYDRVKDAIKET